MAAEDHDWKLPSLLVTAQLLQQRYGLDPRQAYVQEDQVRRSGGEPGQRLLTASNHVDQIAVELELEPVHLRQGGVVLHEEDANLLFSAVPGAR
jgi:hypothetical protein